MIAAHIELILVVTGAATAIAVDQCIAPVQFLRLTYGEAPVDLVSVALASQEGFAYWAAQATMLYGWTLMAQGQHADGIAQILQGLSARHATGASLYRASHLPLLAEAYGEAGQIEEGLRTVAEALLSTDTTGERLYEAELHRIEGELVLQQAPTDTSRAERCFQRALAIARCQQAKSWELRAAMSLSRLWGRSGEYAKAHQLPAGCYDWYTDGFDTTDLRAAQGLLAALA